MGFGEGFSESFPGGGTGVQPPRGVPGFSPGIALIRLKGEGRANTAVVPEASFDRFDHFSDRFRAEK